MPQKQELHNVIMSRESIQLLAVHLYHPYIKTEKQNLKQSPGIFSLSDSIFCIYRGHQRQIRSSESLHEL